VKKKPPKNESEMNTKKEQNLMNQAGKLVTWLQNKAIDGVSPLSKPEDLAKEYLIDQSYPDNNARVEALINWETAKNFTSGFITGFGGLLTLPLSIPSAIGAAWVIQARLAATIAVIYGHNIHDDRVKTLVLISILGDVGKEALKKIGITVGRKTMKSAITKMPGKVILEINKRVGFRLLTKAGERGAINLTKFIPVGGGLIGGTFDAVLCRQVGITAKKLFRPNNK
jgi:hypothetical protein